MAWEAPCDFGCVMWRETALMPSLSSLGVALLRLVDCEKARL
jgi:hypothetical protein